MDPQTTWDELLAALHDHDSARIEEHADALAEWLAKGGFPPDTGGGAGLGDEWHRHLAQAAVAFALASVRDEKEKHQ